MTNNQKPALAIIGCGMAGLACATALSDRFTVSIFDKSRGPSGRMSTRRAEAHMFDHGAQYFRAGSDDFKNWLEPLGVAGHVRPWPARAVQMAADGTLSAKQDADEKLVFAPSMNAIGKVLLAGRPQIKAYLDCQITTINGSAHDWHLHSEKDSFGPFEMVVSAIPAVQAVALLPENADFAAALGAVKMIGCHTLMLGVQAGEIDMPDWDCAHFDDAILGFAAVNSRKPGRGGGDALVVQTNHGWSEAHIETDLAEIDGLIKQRLKAVTGLSVRASGYDRLHRWRYASTASPLGQDFALDESMGLAAIGDWCLGSKVEDAFVSGFALAKTFQ